MASDDLRAKLRRILAEADGFDPDLLDPNDYEHADQILALFQPELDVLRAKVTALEACYEVVAADAMAHGLCSMKLHGVLRRAERAEAALQAVREAQSLGEALAAVAKHDGLTTEGAL